MIIERSQWEGLLEQLGRKVSGRVSQKDLWNKYCENLVEELVREVWEECVREINQRVFSENSSIVSLKVIGSESEIFCMSCVYEAMYE